MASPTKTWTNSVAGLAIVAAVSACSTNTNAPTISDSSNQEPETVKLSKEQVVATQSGVRRMIPNPDSASFFSATARKAKEGPGLDVCGHVRYLDNVSKKRVEQPYYVELRETNGQPNAERGQVGGDPAKLSKVQFLCRNHK